MCDNAHRDPIIKEYSMCTEEYKYIFFVVNYVIEEKVQLEI